MIDKILIHWRKLLLIAVIVLMIKWIYDRNPLRSSTYFSGSEIDFQPVCDSTQDAGVHDGVSHCYKKCTDNPYCNPVTSNGAWCEYTAPFQLSERRGNDLFTGCPEGFPNTGGPFLDCFKTCPPGMRFVAHGLNGWCEPNEGCNNYGRDPEAICPLVGDQAGTPIPGSSRCKYPSNAIKNDAQLVAMQNNPRITGGLEIDGTKDKFLQGYCFAKNADGSYPNIGSTHCQNMCKTRGTEVGTELQIACDTARWKNFYCKGSNVIDPTNQICTNWCMDTTATGGAGGVCETNRKTACAAKLVELKKAVLAAESLAAVPDTHFVADATKQTAPDANGNGNVIFLDRHNIDCVNKPMNGLQLVNEPDSKIRYNYKCSSGNISGQPFIKTTEWNTRDNVIHLDRHAIDCGSGAVLSQLKLENSADNKMRYSYTCIPTTNSLTCREVSTALNDDGEGNSIFLDRHNVTCNNDEVLQKLKLVTDPVQKKYQYKYTCCKKTNLK
jgi:hypothetical protein